MTPLRWNSVQTIYNSTPPCFVILYYGGWHATQQPRLSHVTPITQYAFSTRPITNSNWYSHANLIKHLFGLYKGALVTWIVQHLPVIQHRKTIELNINLYETNRRWKGYSYKRAKFYKHITNKINHLNIKGN